MKADAIKLVAAAMATGIEPTDDEVGKALAEVVDIALGFFANVERIGNAAERLAGCVDGGSFGPASFGTHDVPA